MKLINHFNISLLALSTIFASCSKEQKKAENENPQQMEKKEVIKHRFTYLTMNGEFKMDPKNETTVKDERNPSRIILSTSEEKGTATKITFFDHNDDKKVIAECSYQFIGSRPDPFYFPEESKTSIWDVFEKIEDHSGDCSKFKFVVSRSPHDEPLHMHLRYGDNVEDLLNMSKDAKDDKFNPWWPEYIGVSEN